MSGAGKFVAAVPFVSKHPNAPVSLADTLRKLQDDDHHHVPIQAMVGEADENERSVAAVPVVANSVQEVESVADSVEDGDSDGDESAEEEEGGEEEVPKETDVEVEVKEQPVSKKRKVGLSEANAEPKAVAKIAAKPKAKIAAKPKATIAAKPKAKIAAKPKAKTVAKPKANMVAKPKTGEKDLLKEKALKDKEEKGLVQEEVEEPPVGKKTKASSSKEKAKPKVGPKSVAKIAAKAKAKVAAKPKAKTAAPSNASGSMDKDQNGEAKDDDIVKNAEKKDGNKKRKVSLSETSTPMKPLTAKQSQIVYSEIKKSYLATHTQKEWETSSERAAAIQSMPVSELVRRRFQQASETSGSPTASDGKGKASAGKVDKK